MDARLTLSLKRNLAPNSVANVTALAVAAGATEAVGTLFGPGGGHDASSSLRQRPSNAVPTDVPIRRLQDVVEPKHRDRLKLVKVDVEGYEDDVLRGLEPLLEQGVRPVLIVEVHTAHNTLAPAYVREFCERHRLRAQWLVEDMGLDDHLAPVDRRLALEDLGNPPDLGAVPRTRYALLLTPPRRAR